MSLNNRFELYKIRREIRRNGTVMKFLRQEKNDFGEPKGEATEVASIKGLYYEHSPHILDAYIILTGAQAASTRTKKMPVLLCPWEDLFEQEEPVDPEPIEPEEPVVPEEPTNPGDMGDNGTEPEVQNEADGNGTTEEPAPEVPPVEEGGVEEPVPEEPVEPEPEPEVPKRCKIQIGDMVMINGHESHVTGVYNVMEWDLICHISFEEIDYGSQSILPGGQKPD